MLSYHVNSLQLWNFKIMYEYVVIKNDNRFPISLGEENIGSFNYILKETINLPLGHTKVNFKIS